MYAIELRDVWKRYQLEYRDSRSLKGELLNLFRRTLQQREFWALKGINLDIRKGEMVGIVGNNGAGKTTLLRLLCGVTKPTKGSIKINGRIAAILELGAGFQDDLTGRENIYLIGSILGLCRKEIQKNVIPIINFADIGDFIDMPVRTYSAGMYLRLGFSITTLLNSDILLIDEVLAVGDLAFQKKCFNRIKELRKQNKTIIFVSHNLSTVRQLCQRVILMDKGNIIYNEQSNRDIKKDL